MTYICCKKNKATIQPAIPNAISSQFHLPLIHKSNASLIKEKVKTEVTSDLTETEIEKFNTLAQDVEYSNEEGYAEKLNTIKESYFPRNKTEKTSNFND